MILDTLFYKILMGSTASLIAVSQIPNVGGLEQLGLTGLVFAIMAWLIREGQTAQREMLKRLDSVLESNLKAQSDMRRAIDRLANNLKLHEERTSGEQNKIGDAKRWVPMHEDDRA